MVKQKVADFGPSGSEDREPGHTARLDLGTRDQTFIVESMEKDSGIAWLPLNC